MSLRTFSLTMLLLASACSDQGAPNPVAEAPAENRIECAVGDAPMERACMVETEGTTITVRHMDGRIRRFAVVGDGMIDVADGAESIEALADGSIRVGDARYRFP